MGGLMNNYFYGKAGKGDYTVEQMPTTRKQLFFTTLRVRLSSMMGLNFFHVLFCLPLLVMVLWGFQAMMLYTTEDAYKLGGPGMQMAYEQMMAAEGEYAPYRDADVKLAELELEMNRINSELGRIANGETVTKELPPVVEGGEPEIVEKTKAEIEDEKKATQVGIDEIQKRMAEENFTERRQELEKDYLLKKIEYEAYRSSAMKSSIMMTLIFLIPLMGLAGIGSTGQMYVLRNWARDEHSFMWQDYKAAIKNNWKQGLVVGMLNGLSLLLCYVAYDFYTQMAGTGSVFYEIPRWLMVMFLIVWWMMNEVIFPMMVTYDFKIRQLIRNSFIMVIARLPISFLILLGSTLIPFALILLLPIQIGSLILLLFYGLIGFSLTGFIYASYANSLFDRYLNPRIEGAEVNKGLRPLEDDEDDEEEAKPLPEVEQKEDRFWERKS